jgi:hypothetical protein
VGPGVVPARPDVFGSGPRFKTFLRKLVLERCVGTCESKRFVHVNSIFKGLDFGP